MCSRSYIDNIVSTLSYSDVSVGCRMRPAFALGLPDGTPDGLAGPRTRRIMDGLMVTLRGASALVGAVAAVVGLAPPARVGWTLVCAALFVAWSAVFVHRVSRHGSSPLLVAGDLAVVVGLCLAHRMVVPDGTLLADAGTSWVDLAASSGVVIAQFGLRQPAGIAAGLLVVVAYTVGLGHLREATAVLVLQAVIPAIIATLLLRAASATDAALRDEASSRARAIVDAAVRVDERNQQRHLHDTVLATLTMVNTGPIDRDSVTLRLRAAADLSMIEQLRAHPATAPCPDQPRTRLDLVLRSAAVTPPAGATPLRVTYDLVPLELPTEIVIGLAGCVAEALTNVGRHAGTTAAHLAARPVGDGVEVVVTDTGIGFDPAAVPAHRRGIRESIAGRMQGLGGTSRVVSSPGNGTEVTVRWTGE
jgi:signal transduction histidine kinase